MNNLFVLFFITSLFSYQNTDQTLDCEFVVFTAPFMSTITDLNSDRSIGPQTVARFSNNQGRLVPNKVHKPNNNELYSYELNEEEGGDNIRIHVYLDLTAMAKNPQDPLLGEQTGTCQFVTH